MISGYHFITMQNSEPDYHSMYIGMEHELSNKSHLFPAGCHNTAVPYLTRETSSKKITYTDLYATYKNLQDSDTSRICGVYVLDFWCT